MIKKIKVIYADGSRKRFDSYQWEIHEDQIRENLEQKGLCKIKYTLLYRILKFLRWKNLN